MMKNITAALVTCALASMVQNSARAEVGDRVEAYEISKAAYIYAFPMIAAYKAMYEFNVDKTSSQYKERGWLTDTLHPEQIPRRRQGVELASGAQWSDLYGHAAVLAEGRSPERELEARADCPCAIASIEARPKTNQRIFPATDHDSGRALQALQGGFRALFLMSARGP